MGNFKKLRVWEDSMNLAEGVYKITRKGDFATVYGLARQLQRAAVSVPSNIAEGDERGTNKESIYFFNVAKGSIAEVITQLILAERIGYIDKSLREKFEKQAGIISASLKNLIKSRSQG